MSQFIESMESRTLLSASPAVIITDLAVLKSAGITAKADLTIALATAKADTIAVKAAVAITHPTKAQKKVLSTYTKAESSAVSKYRGKVNSILAHGIGAGAKLEAALKGLQKHPTSVSARAKVAVALVKLENVFSPTVVTTVETDASITAVSLDGDLDAVAFAVPSAQSAVTATKSHFAADLTTLSTDASAIQTDIETLAVDLA